LSVEIVEHVCSKVFGGQLVDVVANGKSVTIKWAGVTGVNAVLEVVLGDLNLLGCQLVVVVSIKIEV
jgi:hypothetical protein